MQFRTFPWAPHNVQKSLKTLRKHCHSDAARLPCNSLRFRVHHTMYRNHWKRLQNTVILVQRVCLMNPCVSVYTAQCTEIIENAYKTLSFWCSEIALKLLTFPCAPHNVQKSLKTLRKHCHFNAARLPYESLRFRVHGTMHRNHWKRLQNTVILMQRYCLVIPYVSVCTTQCTGIIENAYKTLSFCCSEITL